MVNNIAKVYGLQGVFRELHENNIPGEDGHWGIGNGVFEVDDSFIKTVFKLILHCPVSVASERPTALESQRIGILFGCKRLTLFKHQPDQNWSPDQGHDRIEGQNSLTARNLGDAVGN